MISGDKAVCQPGPMTSFCEFCKRLTNLLKPLLKLLTYLFINSNLAFTLTNATNKNDPHYLLKWIKFNRWSQAKILGETNLLRSHEDNKRLEDSQNERCLSHFTFSISCFQGMRHWRIYQKVQLAINEIYSFIEMNKTYFLCMSHTLGWLNQEIFNMTLLLKLWTSTLCYSNNI